MWHRPFTTEKRERNTFFSFHTTKKFEKCSDTEEYFTIKDNFVQTV